MSYETHGQTFPESGPGSVSVPGRVNLIGEHIDYYGLPVLPMAIEQHVTVRFSPRSDRLVHANSAAYGERTFSLDSAAVSGPPPGDWELYLRAAAIMLSRRWALKRGLDAAVSSNLPPAAGLSSSSALLTAFALALLRANGIAPSLTELLELLPEGEQHVGTRGGGMDHAAVLAARAGCALLIRFEPFAFEHIPVPGDWTFLIAHSLTTAEKSGALKAEYNARRTAGLGALERLGWSDFSPALREPKSEEKAAATLTGAGQNAFRHAVTEARRVESAVAALRAGDADLFGALLTASHASLRDRLLVSNPALDRLVCCALEAGALGARLTGAGFGGCVLVLCRSNENERVRRGLLEGFYARAPGFDPARHLFAARPSGGALGA